MVRLSTGTPHISIEMLCVLLCIVTRHTHYQFLQWLRRAKELSISRIVARAEGNSFLRICNVRSFSNLEELSNAQFPVKRASSIAM